MTNTYKIADRIIAVSSLHEVVHRLCADYLFTSGKPDFALQITQQDIDFEREKSVRRDEAEGIPIRMFSDSYLEVLAVYRRIAEKMPDYDTILFHGSCVAVDGAGYVFTADSGTGKSTHAKLWRELLGDRAVMVNDDKPLIRVTEAGATVYGTPWDGKHRLSTNIAVPLKALCFLEQAEHNSIRQIEKPEAYRMLAQQAYHPMDALATCKTLDLIDRLTRSVSFWHLKCNTQLDAARVAYTAMKGKD